MLTNRRTEVVLKSMGVWLLGGVTQSSFQTQSIGKRLRGGHKICFFFGGGVGKWSIVVKKAEKKSPKFMTKHMIIYIHVRPFLKSQIN